MSKQNDVKKIINNYNRRLQILKEKQALTGLATDPAILIEIEDIEAKIAELQPQLEINVGVSPLTTTASVGKAGTVHTGSKIPKLFYSYAHKDETMRDKLATHLKILQRQEKITVWYDRQIGAGDEWERQITTHLNSADIILLLISPDFMASDFCYNIEMERAIKRHNAREAVVIPVILRPTDWTGVSFSKLQALPKNAKPVTLWPDEDEAYLNIAEGIRKVAERFTGKP